ncbi:hypothetical protein E8E13_007219 [Curvularia kusanoi]|uniref:Uncharacterized protein n=1 Tax=Curvularia kusanoi TaxID=90978 RepID=A0A9P4TA82_CURKU|nr:hypothetical protein E8E13_007219 [Curvularia kusanoi]
MKLPRVLILAIIVTWIIYGTFSVYEQKQVPEPMPHVFIIPEYQPYEVDATTPFFSTETPASTAAAATVATESVCPNMKTNGLLVSSSEIMPRVRDGW